MRSSSKATNTQNRPRHSFSLYLFQRHLQSLGNSSQDLQNHFIRKSRGKMRAKRKNQIIQACASVRKYKGVTGKKVRGPTNPQKIKHHEEDYLQTRNVAFTNFQQVIGFFIQIIIHSNHVSIRDFGSTQGKGGGTGSQMISTDGIRDNGSDAGL